MSPIKAAGLYFENLALEVSTTIKQRADRKAAAKAAEEAVDRTVDGYPVTKLPPTPAEQIAIRDARRERNRMRKTTFPNLVGNYPGKRTPKPDHKPLTARERFHDLVAAFVAKRRNYRFLDAA